MASAGNIGEGSMDSHELSEAVVSNAIHAATDKQKAAQLTVATSSAAAHEDAAHEATSRIVSPGDGSSLGEGGDEDYLSLSQEGSTLSLLEEDGGVSAEPSVHSLKQPPTENAPSTLMKPDTHVVVAEDGAVPPAGAAAAAAAAAVEAEGSLASHELSEQLVANVLHVATDSQTAHVAAPLMVADYIAHAASHGPATDGTAAAAPSSSSAAPAPALGGEGSVGSADASFDMFGPLPSDSISSYGAGDGMVGGSLDGGSDFIESAMAAQMSPSEKKRVEQSEKEVKPPPAVPPPVEAAAPDSTDTDAAEVVEQEYADDTEPAAAVIPAPAPAPAPAADEAPEEEYKDDTADEAAAQAQAQAQAAEVAEPDAEAEPVDEAEEEYKDDTEPSAVAAAAAAVEVVAAADEEEYVDDTEPAAKAPQSAGDSYEEDEYGDDTEQEAVPPAQLQPGDEEALQGRGRYEATPAFGDAGDFDDFLGQFTTSSQAPTPEGPRGGVRTIGFAPSAGGATGTQSMNGSPIMTKRTVSPSRSVSSSGSKKPPTTKQQLKIIEAQIKEVQRQKMEITATMGSAPTRGRSPLIKSYEELKEMESSMVAKPKKAFHHPQLEYVVEKIIHSPYMTRPIDQYPESTFKIPVAIDALTKRGIKYKSIPKDRAPFDFAESRRTFVREVINFRPQYGKPVKMQDSVAFDESVGKDGISQLDSQTLSREPSTELHTAGGTGKGTRTATLPYKSGMLKAAMARGGPARFRKKITALKEESAFNDAQAVRKAAGGALRSSPLDRLKDKEKLIPDWDFSALDSLLAQVPSSAQQRHMKAAAMKAQTASASQLGSQSGDGAGLMSRSHSAVEGRRRHRNRHKKAAKTKKERAELQDLLAAVKDGEGSGAENTGGDPSQTQAVTAAAAAAAAHFMDEHGEPRSRRSSFSVEIKSVDPDLQKRQGQRRSSMGLIIEIGEEQPTTSITKGYGGSDELLAIELADASLRNPKLHRRSFQQLKEQTKAIPEDDGDFTEEDFVAMAALPDGEDDDEEDAAGAGAGAAGSRPDADAPTAAEEEDDPSRPRSLVIAERLGCSVRRLSVDTEPAPATLSPSEKQRQAVLASVMAQVSPSSPSGSHKARPHSFTSSPSQSGVSTPSKLHKGPLRSSMNKELFAEALGLTMESKDELTDSIRRARTRSFDVKAGVVPIVESAVETLEQEDDPSGSVKLKPTISRALSSELSDSIRESFKPVSATISEVDENEDEERDAEVARFEREAALLPPLIEAAVEAYDADAPTGGGGGGGTSRAARAPSPAERLVEDVMREGVAASGSFLAAQRDAELMRAHPERYRATLSTEAWLRECSAIANDALLLQRDPHGYVARQTVAAIMKEALTNHLRSLGLSLLPEEEDDEVAALTVVGPELALARSTTQDAIRSAVRSVSPSAMAQATVADVLRRGVSSSERKLRAATPEGVATQAVTDIIRAGLGSSERKLRGQQDPAADAPPDDGDFVSLLGDGVDGFGSLNEGSFVSFDAAALDSPDYGRGPSTFAPNAGAAEDTWSVEVAAALQAAHEAHRACEYAKAEVTLTTTWRQLLAAIAERGGGGSRGASAASSLRGGLAGTSVVSGKGAELDHLKALSATVQVALGRTELALARYEEARRLFAVAGSLRSALFSDQSAGMAEVCEGLGRCALHQALYDEAARQYDAALLAIDFALNSLVRTQEASVGMPSTPGELVTLRHRVRLAQAELRLVRGEYREAARTVVEVRKQLPFIDGLAVSRGNSASKATRAPAADIAAGGGPAPGLASPTNRGGGGGGGDDDGSVTSEAFAPSVQAGRPSWSSEAEVVVDCVELEGRLAMARGRYEKAVKFFRKVLVSKTQVLGLSHAAVAATLGRLAECEMLRCDYQEGQKLIKAAIDMNRRYVKTSHPQYLDLLSVKVRLSLCMGKHETALEGADDCLARRRDALAPLIDHPDIADSLFTLAEATRAAGHPRAALRIYDECHQMRCRLYPLERGPHADTCASALGLALCSLDKGAWSLSATRLVQTVASHEALQEALGVPAHPEVEFCKLQLARNYVLLADYAKAKPLLSSAGKALGKLLGGKHLHVADSIYVLALFKHHTGKYSDARALFVRCQETLAQTLDQRHPKLLRARLALSETYRAVGYFHEAIETLNGVLQTLSAGEMGGDLKGHPMHAHLIHARSKMLRDVGNFDEATKFFSYVLEAFTKEYGNKSAHVAYVLGDMGECLRLEKSDDAEAYLMEARRCREGALGRRHPAVAEVLISEALALVDNMRMGEGIALLESTVLPLLQATVGDGHPLCVYAMGCVGLGLTIASMTVPSSSIEEGSLMMLGGAMEGSDTTPLAQGSTATGTAPTIDERGQTLIYEALTTFDTYPLSPFGDTHPWVLELGGYDALGQGSGEVSVAVSQGDGGGRRAVAAAAAAPGADGLDGGPSMITMSSADNDSFGVDLAASSSAAVPVPARAPPAELGYDSLSSRQASPERKPSRQFSHGSGPGQW